MATMLGLIGLGADHAGMNLMISHLPMKSYEVGDNDDQDYSDFLGKELIDVDLLTGEQEETESCDHGDDQKKKQHHT